MAGVWRSIRDRDDIQVAVVPLPAGLEGCALRTPWGWAILLSDQLTQVERRAVLAHELAHVEAGGGAGWHGQPATWAAVVARDEARTDRRAAERLVDVVHLDMLAASGEVLTVEDVAEQLGVPAWVVRQFAA